MKTIGLASDHAGFELKQYVKKWLEAKGWEYKDFGTYTTDSCDYPDFAHPLALAVENGECYPGIAICGSGEGIGITLNKHQGIRAALCWIPEIAHLARQHNNANVLVMPGRFIDEAMADKIMTEFFTTDFEGGRHQARRLHWLNLIFPQARSLSRQPDTVCPCNRAVPLPDNNQTSSVLSQSPPQATCFQVLSLLHGISSVRPHRSAP